jgi:nitroreductase
MIEKPAETTYPIHDLLRRRWSPRAFSDRLVEPEKLQSLFEAARWAPSSFNEQPWHFIVCTKENPADHERLLGCLSEGNIPWARQAPVLMLSVARLHFTRTGRPNRHALHDVGLATENLVIQAVALGLAVHQMAGFDMAKARSAFGIPADFEPAAAIAVGYQGEPAQLPAQLRDRELAPRSRKPLLEFIFGGQWGQPSSLVGRPQDKVSGVSR